MPAYDFTPPDSAPHHICHGRREGDWIVYSCPECDYEMREHWETGEMQVRNVKMDIRHSGSYTSPELLNFADSLLN